jgi:hypothetical protein
LRGRPAKATLHDARRIHTYTQPELEALLVDGESDLVERRHRAASFDAQVVLQASIEALDRTLFERTYRPAAFAPDVLAANERSFEQRLAATKMIASVDEPVPTVSGLLTLGHRPRDFVPGAYVQFLRILGTELSDPIQDEATLDGPIVEVLRGLDGKLASHNRTSVDITSGAVEQRASDYPLAALQQLVRNAVMHRTYEQTNAPVRVVCAALRGRHRHGARGASQERQPAAGVRCAAKLGALHRAAAPSALRPARCAKAAAAPEPISPLRA